MIRSSSPKTPSRDNGIRVDDIEALRDQPKTIFRCRSGYHFGVYNAVGTGIVELRCPYTKCKKGKVKAVHYFDYGTGRLLETLWEFELK
jgi:hypothetical protein